MAALGLFTTLAEAWEGFKEFANFYDPVGPLAGKTIFAVIVWLVAWGILHARLRTVEHEMRRALGIALALTGLGVLGTFPAFFQLFHGG